jgi:hypothetical protein
MLPGLDIIIIHLELHVSFLVRSETVSSAFKAQLRLLASILENLQL